MLKPSDFWEITFTGHREVHEVDLDDIVAGLKRVEQAAYGPPVIFHSGGASGFDTLVLHHVWPHISAVHTVHVPFFYQLDALMRARGLHAQDFEIGLTLCSTCGPVLWSKNELARYQRRNEHMVDGYYPDSRKLVVSYFNGAWGGTKNCIDYAKSKGVKVVDVREFDANALD